MTHWYVVGGAVRDLLLGREAHDIDISFSGGAESFLQIFPKARKVGGDLSIWLVGSHEFTGIKGSAAEDMLTRDLTINAASFDAEGRIIAHPLFFSDLEHKILRLSSQNVLACDPLRVYRVARFAADLPDFSIAPSTLEAMRAFSLEHADALAALPPERVGRELLRALACPVPSRFFVVLKEAGCLMPWFPELLPAADIPAGPSPWHNNSVLEHTLQVMDRCAGSPLAVWMALCHDLGKIKTNPSALPHHYGHDTKGMELAKALSSRLCLSSRYARAALTCAGLHMKGGMYGILRPGTRRDLLYSLEASGIFHDFWAVALADSGINWEPMALRDLNAIRAVRLPYEWRNRGAASGEKLRMLQCEAISRLPKFFPEKEAHLTPMPEEKACGNKQKPRRE